MCPDSAQEDGVLADGRGEDQQLTAQEILADPDLRAFLDRYGDGPPYGPPRMDEPTDEVIWRLVGFIHRLEMVGWFGPVVDQAQVEIDSARRDLSEVRQVIERIRVLLEHAELDQMTRQAALSAIRRLIG